MSGEITSAQTNCDQLRDLDEDVLIGREDFSFPLLSFPFEASNYSDLLLGHLIQR